ncbi:MAG TPA: penicillin-binding protein 2 [Gemmatimonadaceae bacterium]
MSFHPNEVARRGRAASVVVALALTVLAGAFFRAQVLENAQYALQSEENRLREVPLPAPRGIIYDRKGQIIAENLPGYSVSILGGSVDSLRATLRRLGTLIPLSQDHIELAVRRYRRAPNRPTVVLSDASFDVVSVLEERRVDFPSLVIQASPKRYYPDGPAVASFVGYTGEITDEELAKPEYRDQGYKAGQQIGKGGLERQYEELLRGKEGTRFVEVDARGRVVREAGARQDLLPEAPAPLYTNIDLDLQRFVAQLMDTLQGGVMAMDPISGEVLALHSAPSFDPNRFIGGIPVDYWRELNTDVRRPLYNKVIQGKYPPASTWKLAASLIALQDSANPISMDTRMPTPCTGGIMYGNRYFRCWDRNGHGNVTLQQAIEKSCNVYFYQLGLRITLRRLVAGGISLGFADRSGIDLPNENRPTFPLRDVEAYYNSRYGPRGWSNAVTLNLSIGQGENDQTVANMAHFYSALATDGRAATPVIAKKGSERKRLFTLTDDQMLDMREALAGVVSARGTAGSAAIRGLVLAGKTGTVQNPPRPDHAWFVGFAPADDPKIVVAVMLEFGEHGYFAARIASRIVEFYLKAAPAAYLNTEG